MEIGLLAAACGAELQNLFQGEVGPSLAQSVGLKGAGRVGECQLAFVVLSSERGWQTLGFWSQDWLGWLLEKFPLSFSNTFTPKLASNHSLSVCPGSTGQQRFRQWYLLVKDGVDALPSCLETSIHCMEYNISAFIFFLFPHTCVSQISRVDPQVDLFERKSVGNLLEDVDFRGLCLPCLCQTQTTDSMRWLFTEKVVSCYSCLLFSMISWSPGSGSSKHA